MGEVPDPGSYHTAIPEFLTIIPAPVVSEHPRRVEITAEDVLSTAMASFMTMIPPAMAARGNMGEVPRPAVEVLPEEQVTALPVLMTLPPDIPFDDSDSDADEEPNVGQDGSVMFSTGKDGIIFWPRLTGIEAMLNDRYFGASSWTAM
jgi:hypothetical protein